LQHLQTPTTLFLPGATCRIFAQIEPYTPSRDFVEVTAMYTKTSKPDAVVVTLLLFTLGTLLTATVQVMLG
jgi:hypothetical protein